MADTKPAAQIDQFTADELVRMRRKLDSIDGPYVTKGPDFIVIGAPPLPPKAPPPSPIGLRPVLLSIHTSSPGDDTTECAHTYDLYADTDVAKANALATNIGMTGHGQRQPIGAMTEGTVGFAKSGNPWKLYWADEQVAAAACDIIA